MRSRLRKEHVVQPSSILVVDREPTIVDLILEILTDGGYIAYTLPDGIAAGWWLSPAIRLD